MALQLLKKTALKQAGKALVPIGAGAVAAQAGGAILRAVSPETLGTFGAEPGLMGEVKAASVDALGGVLLGGIGLGIVEAMDRRPRMMENKARAAAGEKARPSKAVAMAPFVAAGVGLGAFGPVVLPRIAGFVVDGIDKVMSFLPFNLGPSVLPPAGGTVRLPASVMARYRQRAGGLYGDPAEGLGGSLRRPGGLYADPGKGLGGSLNRQPGGLMSEPDQGIGGSTIRRGVRVRALG